MQPWIIQSIRCLLFHICLEHLKKNFKTVLVQLSCQKVFNAMIGVEIIKQLKQCFDGEMPPFNAGQSFALWIADHSWEQIESVYQKVSKDGIRRHGVRVRPIRLWPMTVKTAEEDIKPFCKIGSRLEMLRQTSQFNHCRDPSINWVAQHLNSQPNTHVGESWYMCLICFNFNFGAKRVLSLQPAS